MGFVIPDYTDDDLYVADRLSCDLKTCYIFISSSLSHISLSEKDFESLGWNDLVAQKRQLTSELKELSDKIVDIDRSQLRSIGNSIKVQCCMLRLTPRG